MEEEEIPELVPTTLPSIPSNKISAIRKIPVTIITGMLGSGKTTLVLSLLSNPSLNKRIAVILNEYGSSSSIDKSLQLTTGKDSTNGQAGSDVETEWLELANGCFCCSIKNPGVKAIENLLAHNKNFDYVLLETTGLADPGPIASMFWLDESLQSQLYLDSVVTVVDSKNIQSYLLEDGLVVNEATKQIAIADLIILNKIDLLEPNELEQVKDLVASINSSAGIHQTVKSGLEPKLLFDLHCFDKDTTNPFETTKLHTINPRVSTVSFTTSGIVSQPRMEYWVQQLLWENSILGYQSNPKTELNILRFKAMIDTGGENIVVVQAVNETYDVQTGRAWNDQLKENKLVFIGVIPVDLNVLKQSFISNCIN